MSGDVDSTKAEQAIAGKLEEFGENVEAPAAPEGTEQPNEPREEKAKVEDVEDYEPDRPTEEIVAEYKEKAVEAGEPEEKTPEPTSPTIDPDLYLAGEGVGLTREQVDARIRARGEDAVRAELEDARSGILGEFGFLSGGQPTAATAGFGGPGVPNGPNFGQPPAQQPVSGAQPTAPTGQVGSDGKSLADLTDEQIQEAREEYGDLYADNLERMRNDARIQRDFIVRQQQAEQARQAAELDRWYDEAAKEGYAEAFGTSRASATPEQLRLREQVLLTAVGIRQAHLARGQDISPRAAWSRAVLAVASDLKKDSARRQVEEKVEKRSQTIGFSPSVPGSGRAANSRRSAPPEVQAVQKIEDWYRQRGMEVPSE